jgi:BTB/POZ domain
METDTLLAKIHALEEQLQKLTSDCDKAFNYLSQQQQHQEKEWESRLETLEAKITATANNTEPRPVCSSPDRLESRDVHCPDGEPVKTSDRKDPCGKDVLHLNIGGSKQIAVLRSTLTFVEGSMLATKFSGRWDDSLEKDRDGNFFIDQPPDLFIPMIDFLQCKTKETLQHLNVSFPSVDDFRGSFDRFKKFANMVEFYGLTAAVLPPTIRLLNPNSPSKVRISGHYVASPARWTVFFDLATQHWEPRQIQSFDVTIDDAGSLRVGWAIHQEPNRFAESQAWVKSIRFGCQDNVVRYQHSPVAPRGSSTAKYSHAQLETGMSVLAGCVIRSERIGSKFIWTVDGKSFAHDPSTLLYDCASYVPSIAGGGKWWISNIEYEEVSP